MTETTSTLTPTLFRRLHPRPYLEKFLSEGVRPDGRTVTEDVKQVGASDIIWRDASMNFGSISTAPSSTLVRIGTTTVVCGITLEIAPPEMATPYHGFLVPNIELSPLSSSLFRPGPPSDEAQVLSTRLRDILIASNVLPLASLLIEPAKAAFVVYLDVVCLNYDGGILDAAVLACVGALRTLILPKATWNPDNGLTTCDHPDLNAKPIILNSTPVCVSYGIFNGRLLSDPTLFESQLCSTHITISLALPSVPSNMTVSSIPAELIHVYQAGAPLLSIGTHGSSSQDILKQCITMARIRAEALKNLLLSQ